VRGLKPPACPVVASRLHPYTPLTIHLLEHHLAVNVIDLACCANSVHVKILTVDCRAPRRWKRGFGGGRRAIGCDTVRLAPHRHRLARFNFAKLRVFGGIGILFLDVAKNSAYTADKSGRRSKRMGIFVYAKRSCYVHCSSVCGSTGRT